MNIGLLNVRIYIQKNEVISDAIENRKNAWKNYYTCYATVSAETGKESTDAGLVIDDSKIDFTMSKYLAIILSASQLLSHLEQRKRQLMKKETTSNPVNVLISLL